MVFDAHAPLRIGRYALALQIGCCVDVHVGREVAAPIFFRQIQKPLRDDKVMIVRKSRDKNSSRRQQRSEVKIDVRLSYIET